MESVTSGNLSAWEQAYTQFETPEEEIAKFTARLVTLGARAWPRQAQVVEPWLTPFLSFAHFVCALRPAHLLSRKVWALATMIEHERETYEQWLAQPDLILSEIRRSFDIAMLRIRLGKLMLVGFPRRQVQK